MTLQHRNVAHRMLVVRQAGGAGGVGDGAGGKGAGAGGLTDPPVVTPPSPPVSSTPSQQQPPPSSPPSTPSQTPQNPKPTTKTTPSSTNSPTKPSTSPPANSPSSQSSSSSSSSSPSSSTSSSSSSVSAAPVVLNTNKAIANTPTQGYLPTSSFSNVTPTDIDSAGTTVTADPITTSGATGMSTGSIVGIVAGTLIGLTIIGFLSLYLLRRLHRNRRHANRHESDFGTFNRSAFVKEKEPPVLPDMAERGHNVAPSLSGEQMAVGVATPPSQQLAAANAAAAASTTSVAPLQERPKYVFGQIPAAAHDTPSEDDVSEVAGGVYSSQPQAQMAYNPEAYGSYARYDDAGQGVVGGVGVAVGGGYQDAQREYQGQQGYYDQNGQQSYYDQNQQYDQQGYAIGYDNQAQYAEGQYDYSQQHEQYAQQQQPEPEQSAYQAPHPYANGAAASVKAAGHNAYGGM